MNHLRATQSFAVADPDGGATIMVNAGDIYAADDPICEAAPAMFADPAESAVPTATRNTIATAEEPDLEAAIATARPVAEIPEPELRDILTTAGVTPAESATLADLVAAVEGLLEHPESPVAPVEALDLLSERTVRELREMLEDNNITPPSKAVKADLVALATNLLTPTSDA